MRKYGIEHFHIEEVEKCSIENLEEREKYWIEYYKSFKYGYNATLGGDGKPYIDYNLVISTYNRLKNQTKTAEYLNISLDSVKRILKICNIKTLSSAEVNILQRGKIINQLSLDNTFIRTFASAREAAKFVKPNAKSINGVSAHILAVCNKKRKTAYGYYWEYG